MIHNIALLMISEGLLTREALERAVARKRVQGGSLALNLVLEGAVDELSLAEFYARKLDLGPANEEMLLGIDPATFHLIPLEIVYESGILPLYLQGDEALVVGLVDPTDSELLAEAAFFSGFTLTSRIITVSQMARHFARLARQPWKMTVEEAERAMRPRHRPLADLNDVDALLEQTTAFDHHVDARLQASLDETYGEPTIPLESPFPQDDEPTPLGLWSIGEAAAEPASEGPSMWVAGRPLEEISQIRLKPIRLDVHDTAPAVVVDEAYIERATGSTAQRLAVQQFDGEAYPGQLAEIEVSRDMVDSLGMRPSEATDLEGQLVVEGDVVTATGRMHVLAFAVDHGPTEPEGFETAEPVPVVADRASGFALRPRTKVPARPPMTTPEPAAMHAHLHPMNWLGEALGPADPAVLEALERIVEQLDRVRLRDELGDSVVYGLSELYETVALMTLNGPRAVVWRCQVGGLPDPEKVGDTVDLEAGSLLHRVSEEQLFFWGPLPRQTPLRALFDVTHDRPVLVAPVGMRGRTILMLVLDSGASLFPSPGGHLERLLVELARGLERVILLRRRGRRKA